MSRSVPWAPSKSTHWSRRVPGHDVARVSDVRRDAFRVAEILLGDLVDRIGGQFVELLEDVVLLDERRLELLAEDVLVGEV